MRLTRRKFVAVAGPGSLAGCTGRADTVLGDGSASSDDGPTSNDDGSAPDDGGSTSAAGGAVPTAEETLPLPMAPEELESRAVSGGPPKDGIPSIDDPSFVGPDDADFLDPGDPVFGVARNGVVKASHRRSSSGTRSSTTASVTSRSR